MNRVRDLIADRTIGHISPFKRNGEVIGWVTVLGRAEDGQRRRRFFKEKDQAEQFLDEHVRLSVDPLHGRRHEVMFSLERVDRVGVSLNEVVEFYLKHGSKKTNPPLSDAITSFLDHKRMIGRGPHYLDRMTVVFGQLTKFVGETTKVGDITSDQIRKLVYVEHSHTSPKSKQNFLTHLSVFFGFCVQHDLSSFNPVKKVERPTVKFNPPHVMKPDDFSTLLHYCLENDFTDRLTMFVLVGFCGIRLAAYPGIIVGRNTGGSWMEGSMAPFEGHWPLRKIEDNGIAAVCATMCCDMRRPEEPDGPVAPVVQRRSSSVQCSKWARSVPVQTRFKLLAGGPGPTSQNFLSLLPKAGGGPRYT